MTNDQYDASGPTLEDPARTDLEALEMDSQEIAGERAEQDAADGEFLQQVASDQLEADDPAMQADLSYADRIADGENLATQLDDDERSERRVDGVVPLDEEVRYDDEGTQETIEDRIQQEVPDPTSSIVPPDAGRRA